MGKFGYEREKVRDGPARPDAGRHLPPPSSRLADDPEARSSWAASREGETLTGCL